MVRITGVNLPVEKRVVIALTRIYGIGNSTAFSICKELKIPLETRVNQLSEEQVAKIRKYIDKELIVEGELRSLVYNNIKTLINIACYRGLRHRTKMPVRGQNTQSNAMIARGKKRPSVSKKS